MIDYTRLIEKLVPAAGGEDVLRLRTAVVDAVNQDGTVDVVVSGLVIPGVPRLAGTTVLVNDVVSVGVYRGQLLVLGVTAATAGGSPAIACRAVKTSDQTIPNNSDTTVSWQNFSTVGSAGGYNRGGFTISSGSDIVVPFTGLYNISAHNIWEADNTDYRMIFLLCSRIGTGIADNIAFNGRALSTVLSGRGISVSTTFLANAGNFFRVRARQRSGGDLDILSHPGTAVAITYLGAIPS